MTKAPRFPRRIDCWMSEAYADAIEQIADARSVPTSIVVREIIGLYLNHAGLLPQRPARPNGQQHHEVSL
jgi:hypothetical protein